ncbi:hypothetical protein EXN22_15435 [Pseudomonas tructae]|uniref:Dermonecrotic toxin N-terminal domain-containing protein n=1 Tax=Pseudomonas tructae TaxID=2518644 RepID=A0A411MJP6_9PSED|nr:DUF6543 domain-containing protein [Pseudomonas tructae]QBF27015.1 hypothetical protein EXN22_15435 [Pseudomonas tructae]
MSTIFESPGSVSALRQAYRQASRASFEVAVHSAYIKGHIGADTYHRFTAMQANNSVIAQPPLHCSRLLLLNTPLSDVLLFCVETDDTAAQACTIYMPHDPLTPLSRSCQAKAIDK